MCMPSNTIMGMPYHVYITASQTRGTLYTGLTNDIARRMMEHREGKADGFTAKHGVRRLVHIETYPTIAEAIAREKRLKRWRRAWKIALIEEHNPDWHDLFRRLNG